MAGLLEGLRDVLGGFADVKQIDQSGFDFREKRRQQELERQRQQQEWQQADEDRALKVGEDVLAGSEGDQMPDVSALFPAGMDQERRRLYIQSLAGRAKERKSALESTKAYNARLLQTDKDTAALERERYKGELKSKLMQDAEEIRQNQQMSPREKEAMLTRIQAQLELFGAAESGRNRRWGNMPVQVPTGEIDEYGNPQYQFQPRKDVIGDTFSKPNLSETGKRVEGELARETMAGNLDTIQRQLDSVKEFAGLGAVTSPMDAFNARETYKATIRNLAITANRVLGDTSGRYSDVDRQVAAAMLGVASDPILIADPEMAQQRLNEARKTIQSMGDIQKRLRPAPPRGGGRGADPLEGRTATGPNGQKLVRRGGRWIPVQ